MLKIVLIPVALILGFFLCWVIQEKKPVPSVGAMTNARLETLLRAGSQKLAFRDNRWEFEVSGVRMLCVTDESHDRMRIIAPIKNLSALTAEENVRTMEANFHTALDARYAVSNGILWSAFIHPLSPLQESEVRSAMQQVAQLVQTFGSTYSSTDLTFTGAGSNPK